MTGTSPIPNQRDIFQPLLTDFIDHDQPLVVLADRMEWEYFEEVFAEHYSDTGQPAMPIRFMVGCLLLKRIYDYGDETLARAWVMNPYMQYFCGEAYFQHEFRCDPSDLVHFRNRIGEEGVARIFSYSVELHELDGRVNQVLSDSTVQENNTTFPTDAKLAKKAMDHCNRIARAEQIDQRQSYVRVSKQLLRESYFGHHPRRRKKAQKARKTLRTYAGRLLREVERELSEEQLKLYEQDMELYWKAITQERTDSDKVYSLHKPYTACIAKGKAHKKYEFGNKVGLMTHPTRRVVLAIKAFEGNPHDSKTIQPLLEQIQADQRPLPKEVIYDRGGRGCKEALGVKVTTPDKAKAGDSKAKKRRMRRRFRRRAGIEPIIGHLKTDHRMGQNYLHGKTSSQINAYLAAAGWNLKKWMEQWERDGKKLLRLSWLYLTGIYSNKLLWSS
ncbi:MAG: IS5 family transposase [Cyclobacteriaceae bacterium]